jgi:uncharacterized protein DUF4381
VNPTNGPNLRDIHPPAPPSWWPPAPGWWLLAVLLIALVMVASVYLYKKMQVRRRRRALLAEFDRAVAGASGDAPALAATLSMLLRRAQLRRIPQAAAFSGAAWLDHLDRLTGGSDFTMGVGRVLADAPYRAHADFDAPALIAISRRGLLAALDAEEVAGV